VRQPIYGLLIGNLLLFALAFLTRHHGAEMLAAPRRFRLPRRDGRVCCMSVRAPSSAAGCWRGSRSPARWF
jgi:hypothetical protein